MNTLQAEIGLIHGSGFKLENDSLLLSSGSLAHAQKAGDLLVAGNVERLICSGRGPVKSGSYHATEASMMFDYLTLNGIDGKRVLVEDESHSTVANWAYSAEIIEDVGAETVLGIAGKAQLKRARLIGEFVAAKSDFENVGYEFGDETQTMKDYGREFVVRSLTRLFIAQNHSTERSDIVPNYDHFMQSISANQIKKLIHRNTFNN
jgi:uncharacterized SAM-binding protein YcdF (DUF218 family)